MRTLRKLLRLLRSVLRGTHKAEGGEDAPVLLLGPGGDYARPIYPQDLR